MSPKPSTWLPCLDLLRIALSVSVVVYHYYWYGPLNRSVALPASGQDVFMVLSFAVQIFFMVSGFVIAASMHQRSAFDFASARFLRLAPTLGVCSLITFALVNSVTVEPPLQADATRLAYSVLTLPLVASLGLDPSLWSITYELRFYLLAAMSLWLFRQRAVHVLTGAMFALDAVPLMLATMMSPAYLGLNTGFSHHGCFFTLGMMVHLAHRQARQGPVFYLACVFVFWSCGLRTNQDMLGILTRLNVPSPLTVSSLLGFGLSALGMLLLWACVRFRSVNQGRVWHAVQVLGRASFPLYAIHQLAGYWFINLAAAHLAMDIRPALVMLMLMLAVVISEQIEPRVKTHYAWLVKHMRPGLTTSPDGMK